jgi:hypothetical protein
MRSADTSPESRTSTSVAGPSRRSSTSSRRSSEISARSSATSPSVAGASDPLVWLRKTLVNRADA